MGDEARCAARIGGKRLEGKALLETDALIFRGDVRVSIPRKEINAVEATNGTLRIVHSAGEAAFELGPMAAKWAEKIKNPRSLLDKLGVKPGARVAVLGVDDAGFLDQLASRTDDVARRTPKKDTEIIFFGAESEAELARLAMLREKLTPAGAIWVVHRKGKGAPLKDTDVFAAAKRAKLVDVKVAAFSETHTAEKLVIPVKER
jgi:hypothetical protein